MIRELICRVELYASALVEQYDEMSSSSCPPYETVPSIYSHHGQLWAGTPPHFLAIFMKTWMTGRTMCG